MIKSFNNHFKEICKSIKSDKKIFILGLSGGIDSMALLHLLKNFLVKNKHLQIQIYPIIIDHNLRLGSNKEASKVKKIAQNYGFNTTIKKVSGKIPSGNIQNWARKKRRELLFQSTFQFSASLLLAHHFDDQAETLLMRFIKKSGLEGLKGMKHINFWNGIMIIRPLLKFRKDQLKQYVKDNNILFFEDATNSMQKFERVKIRCLLNKIRSEQWPNISEDLNKFSNLNKNLIEKIDKSFSDWSQKNILIDKLGAARINFNNVKLIFERSNLFTTKIFGKVIQTVGGNEYPPKRVKTLDLILSIFTKNVKNKTLGNVRIIKKNNYLFFIREKRNLNLNIEIKKDEYCIYDGRFLLFSKNSGNLIMSNEKKHKWITDSHCFFEYKDFINNTIPSLQTLEGSIIKPHLSIISKETKFNNHRSFVLYLINKILL